MIEFKDDETYKSGARLVYLLDGEWMTLAQLAKLSRPMQLGLTKKCIINRINGVKNGKVKKYTDLKSILTTPLGGRGSWAYQNVDYSTTFIDLMLSMPINDSVPRIMQSRPIS